MLFRNLIDDIIFYLRNNRTALWLWKLWRNTLIELDCVTSPTWASSSKHPLLKWAKRCALAATVWPMFIEWMQDSIASITICLIDDPIIGWFFISFRFPTCGDTSTSSVAERDKPFCNSKFSTESTGKSWTTFPKGATLIYPLTRITVISVTNLTSPLKLASGMESD